MLSHPLTFLVGYVLIATFLSFVLIGPLVVFVSMVFRRRTEKRFNEGLYLGASIVAFAFMLLHYLLYLRGYHVGSWSTLFGDIFYPPRYF